MRDISIKLTPTSGTINWFVVFVGSKKVIDDDGSNVRSWSGDGGQTQATILVKARGFGSATYNIKIDLEGTLNDQELNVNLTGGRHELTLTA